jgi:hypothetical protein
MEEGEIEIDSIESIGLPDITPGLARESGFLGVLDLLKVAKHGKGDNIYLIRFHYVPPTRRKTPGLQTAQKSKVRGRGAITGGTELVPSQSISALDPSAPGRPQNQRHPRPALTNQSDKAG